MLWTSGKWPDQTVSLWLSWPLTSTRVWPMGDTSKRLESVAKEISGFDSFLWLLFCCEVAKFLHWRLEPWSEALAFSWSYIQVSLETATSTLFLCPVGLGPKCVHHSLFLPISNRLCYPCSVIPYSRTTSNNRLSSLSSLYFPYLCKPSCFWTMI